MRYRSRPRSHRPKNPRMFAPPICVVPMVEASEVIYKKARELEVHNECLPGGPSPADVPRWYVPRWFMAALLVGEQEAHVEQRKTPEERNACCTAVVLKARLDWVYRERCITLAIVLGWPGSLLLPVSHVSSVLRDNA